MNVLDMSYFDFDMFITATVESLWITVILSVWSLLMFMASPAVLNDCRRSLRVGALFWILLCMSCIALFCVNIELFRNLQLLQVAMITIISLVLGYCFYRTGSSPYRSVYSSTSHYSECQRTTIMNNLLVVGAAAGVLVGSLAASHPLDNGYSSTAAVTVALFIVMNTTYLRAVRYMGATGSNYRGVKYLTASIILHFLIAAAITIVTIAIVGDESYNAYAIANAVVMVALFALVILNRQRWFYQRDYH